MTDSIRAGLAEWPHAVVLNDRRATLPAGAERFLLFVDDYDPARHGDLWELLETRLTLEITYDSVYGGESFRVRHPIP